MLKLYLLFLFLLTGCEIPSQEKGKWVFIPERSEKKEEIYRIRVPKEWKKKLPSPEDSIEDTTQPNAEFFIEEADSVIKITIHTFPFTEANQIISAASQVHRWKNQLHSLDLLTPDPLSLSHGGFFGLFFEGEGVYQEKRIKMMGWSMQPALFLLQSLQEKDTRRACYTIKAVGPPDLMQRYREDLLRFAKSFELIEEFPSP